MGRRHGQGQGQRGVAISKAVALILLSAHLPGAAAVSTCGLVASHSQCKGYSESIGQNAPVCAGEPSPCGGSAGTFAKCAQAAREQQALQCVYFQHSEVEANRQSNCICCSNPAEGDQAWDSTYREAFYVYETAASLCTSAAPTLTSAPTTSTTSTTTPAATPVCGGGLSTVVVYEGHEYRTLDNIAPATSWTGTHSQYMALPAGGWALAPDNDDAVAVAGAHEWGTYCLVFANGDSERTKRGLIGNRNCGSNYLVQHTTFTTYDIAQGVTESRILIRRPCAGGGLMTPAPTTSTTSTTVVAYRGSPAPTTSTTSTTPAPTTSNTPSASPPSPAQTTTFQVVTTQALSLTSTPLPRALISIKLHFAVAKSYIEERKDLVELAITNVLKAINTTVQVTLTGVEEVEMTRRKLASVAIIDVRIAENQEPTANSLLTLENINKELGALGLPTASFGATLATTTTPVPVTATPAPAKLTADAGQEAALLASSIVGGSIVAVTASVVVSTAASVTASSAAAAGGAAAGGAGAGAGAGGASAGEAIGGATGAGLGPLVSMIGQVCLVPLPRTSSTLQRFSS